MAHDSTLPTTGVVARPRLASGVGLALLSAVSFGASGTLVRGGCSTPAGRPGAATLVRVSLRPLIVVAPLGVLALRGRWSVLRRNLGLVVVYGVLAVAGAQFCYFSAVEYMQVGPALLIEYTSPAAVVVWMWLRHRQRPGPVMLASAGLAALGLTMVLDGARWDRGQPRRRRGGRWPPWWAAATYFVLSADEGTGLPPLTLAGSGLVVGAVTLGLLGAVGLLPMSFSTAPAVYSGHRVPVWLPRARPRPGVRSAGLHRGDRRRPTGSAHGSPRSSRSPRCSRRSGGRLAGARRGATRRAAGRRSARGGGRRGGQARRARRRRRAGARADLRNSLDACNICRSPGVSRAWMGP